GRAGDAAAGAVGGMMGALGGFTGVVPALWCTLRGFGKDEQRAIIQNFNLAILAITFASYVASGVVQRSMLPLLAAVAPAMLVPALLGARLYLRIDEASFRRAVLGLLTASGIALLASGLPVLLGAR
ncbi:TSUP family transporter, partial [Ramlibacter sp.]|uniref:TSUP family transporter n=1 Tax=Ramlibacter sp. TaxID=1917967 RepID=UPI0017D6E67B